jgi:hypothetical protein
MKIEIKSWITGSVIFEGDFSCIADAVKAAIVSRANLSGADLSDSAFPFSTSRELRLGYATARATRITYVGELGWELYVPVEFAAGIAFERKFRIHAIDRRGLVFDTRFAPAIAGASRGVIVYLLLDGTLRLVDASGIEWNAVCTFSDMYGIVMKVTRGYRCAHSDAQLGSVCIVR